MSYRGGGRGRGGGGGFGGNNNFGGQNNGFGGGGGGFGGGGGGGFGSGKGSSKGSKGSKGGGRYNNNSDWGGSKGRGKGGGQKGGKGQSANLPQKMAVLDQGAQGHQQTVTSIVVCEARKQFFSGSTDTTVKVWGWENGFQLVHTVQAGGPVETLYSFDAWLFAGTAAQQGPGGVVNGVVKVWNMDNGFEQALEGHQGSIYCLAQGGPHLFSGGDDMGVKTWQVGAHAGRGTHYPDASVWHGACPSALRAALVLGVTAPRRLPSQFAGEKFEPVIELKGHTSPIQAMNVAGNCLISLERNALVIFWDLSSGQQASGRKAHRLTLTAARLCRPPPRPARASHPCAAPRHAGATQCRPRCQPPLPRRRTKSRRGTRIYARACGWRTPTSSPARSMASSRRGTRRGRCSTSKG